MWIRVPFKLNPTLAIKIWISTNKNHRLTILNQHGEGKTVAKVDRRYKHELIDKECTMPPWLVIPCDLSALQRAHNTSSNHITPVWINEFKGTNGRQKTHDIFHVYCIFYSGFMCQTTVIFGITKDGSLVLNPFASWNCFDYRNLLQNGANDMSEWLTYETAFCKKVQNFV